LLARRLGQLIVLALLILAPAGTASVLNRVTYEAEEDDRLLLDAAGQRNCVLAAIHQEGTDACPFERTPQPRPAMGILLLDDVYRQTGVPEDGPGTARRDAEFLASRPTSGSVPTSFVNDVSSGASYHRASGGDLPDIIAPGHGRFHAYFGWWLDVNGNGVIERSDLAPANGQTSDPEHEWALKPDAAIFSYIDPGPHPFVTEFKRPDKGSPDVAYSSGAHWYTAGSVVPVVFVDGSLIRPMTVTTVTDPLLSPSSDGINTYPYTPGESSMIDIDRYAAIAPGPLSDVYATAAGPFLDTVGSPSLGLCPNACQITPTGARGTPLAGPVATAVSLAYGRAEHETAPGSGASGEGRGLEARDAFIGWADLVPRQRQVPLAGTGRTVASDGEPVGVGTDGSQSMGPGMFTLEMWTGVWKDLGGDGHVGWPQEPGDPYEGGARPRPDNYLESGGEFIGAYPTHIEGTSTSEFKVLAIPDTDWGPLGVTIVNVGLQSRDPGNVIACPPPLASTCMTPIVGSSPVTLLMRRDPSLGAGHYSTQDALLMPLGSPGFSVCSPRMKVSFAQSNVLIEEDVWDCDHLSQWAGFSTAS